MTITLRLPVAVYLAARQHLLPARSRLEQGGFLLAQFNDGGGNVAFDYMDWMPLKAEDYEMQHQDYLELTDVARARVIKHAHDMEACLVELHSHPRPYPAAFSPSDMHGIEEFVPHVRWRLKGRPYAAVVVAPSGFDALAWVGAVKAPVQLHAIETDTEILRATELTLMRRQAVSHGAI